MIARKSKLRLSTALPLLGALLAAAASAADADAAQRQAYYNIPRGDADSALMAFAQTSGLRFLAPSQELAGVRTGHVSGRHTPREALQILLAGTGLTATYGADGTFTVRRADSPDLPANPRGGSASDGAGVDPETQIAQAPMREAERPAGRQLAQAAPAVPAGLEEITVTARRVAENVQTVPVAISVLNSAEIDRQDVRAATDLNKIVPGLQICCGRGNTNFAFLRGLLGIVSYFAEVPQSSVGFGNYFDVGNVQVLKGPQGTLFGIASNGGAMIIEPKRPTDRFEGYVQGTFGTYNRASGEAVINLPLADDRLALRAGILRSHTDGFVKNLATGAELGSEDYWVGRVAVTARPSDRVENYLLANYYRFRGTPQQPVLYAVNPTGPATGVFGLATLNAALAAQQALGRYRVSSLNVDTLTWTRQLNLVDILTWDVSDTVTVKNIAGYVWLRNFSRTDGEGSPLPLNSSGVAPSVPNGGAPAWSEELQVQGKLLDNRLTYTLGTFHTGNTTNPNPQYSNTFGGVSGSISKSSGITRAVYGQANYDLSALLDGLTLTGGYRYTWDLRRAFQVRLTAAGVPTTQFSASGRFSAPSYTVSAAWQATPDTMLYINNSKGYSAGGFNLTAPPQIQKFQPESLNNIEGGIKSQWQLGSMRGRTNLSAYYGFYDDIQVAATVLVPTATGTVLSAATTNAAKGHIQGVEAEATFLPVDSLEITGNLSYMKNRFDRYASINAATGAPVDLSGSVFLYSPKWKYMLRGRYQLPLPASLGELSLSATYSHSSIVYGRVQLAPVNPADILGPVENLDLSLDWDDVAGTAGLDLSMFLTNVTGNIWTLGGFGAYAALGTNSRYGEQPRMFGARVRYSF